MSSDCEFGLTNEIDQFQNLLYKEFILFIQQLYNKKL